MMPRSREDKQILVLLHSEGDKALCELATELARRCGVEALTAHSRLMMGDLIDQAVDAVALIARPWIFSHTTKEYLWAAEVCNAARSKFGNKLPIALMAESEQARQARTKAHFPEDAVQYDPILGSAIVLMWLKQILAATT